MDAVSAVVTQPAAASSATVSATTTTPTSSNVINVNQSNNHLHSSSHSNTHHSGTTATTNSNISISGGGGVNNNSSNSNSSCSSSSTSSNSSGYGSTTTTPTNNYDLQQQTTPTTTPIPTTPVAIAEPIIPVATVAAVTPFYNESITSHNLETHQQLQQHYPLHTQQQQQQLQQQHQHHLLQPNHHHQLPQSHLQPANLQQQQYLSRQQYYSTYDYQQPAPTHNLAAGSSAVPNYNLGIGGPYDTLSASSYGSGQYKSSGLTGSINYERGSSTLRTNPPTLSYNQQQQQPQSEQPQSKTINQQTQPFPGVLTNTKQRSSSLIGNSTSTNTSKPQAAATPFYAQPLAAQTHSNPTAFYENTKYKMPLEYHDTYSNPSAAATASYHQQQKYYAAAKSQLKEAGYGTPPGLNSKSVYPNTGNFYPVAAASYDKYMYPHNPAAGYSNNTGHLGNETPPDVSNYRKPVGANTMNSPSWPWGIDYASGNSRTIPPPPPPSSHLPTATVAPTHATYLTPNPSALSRDPYYMGHEKYGVKYDKYPAAPYQQSYVSPPATRHHVWPNTGHGSNLTQLNDRHLLANGPTAPPSHGLHPTPYFPVNANNGLNSRQSCCSQPYQPQSCYYPPSHPIPAPRLPHNQTPTVAGPSSGYLSSQQPPLGQSPHLNALSASCKYGGLIPDYGNGNKLKNSNDLYLNAHHYDNNTSPHNYGYGSAAHNSQQLYASNAHQSMAHGLTPSSILTHDPLGANPASYTNDLSLTTSNFDNYHTHLDTHLSAPTLAGIHGQQPPPAYGPTVAKRALLDYRKPIQPQPPPTIAEECYTTLSSTRDHYNQQELLNTPETTTTFGEYETQQDNTASLTTFAHPTEVLAGADADKANDEGNKNLSLRDFIANWNDDEDEYQNNEDLNFGQSNVIDEVLQTAPVEQEAAAVVIEKTEIIKTPSMDSKNKLELKESLKSVENLDEADVNQYVNLPDIVIDIEKSNNVNNSITTPSTTPTPPTQTEDQNSSLNLNNFDVEKELDELKLKKPTQQQQEITKDLNDIKDTNTVNTPQLIPCKNLTTQLSFEDLNLEPANKTVLNSDQSSELPENYFKDMEGYESGSSRHSNESAFEKEYETFINKITSDTSTTKSSEEKSAEMDFEKNVQDFSKFYKRKRKLKESELKAIEPEMQNQKKSKPNVASKVNNSNFPQVYTKKSRNRFAKVHQQPTHKRKPLSRYYKIIHSIRRFGLYRSKRVKEYMTELKEKHLPLIKRQSIKNYSHGKTENLCNAKTLKALCVMAINTEEFRQILMLEEPAENSFETEEKHICTDPTCETCEVIKSLMEAESFADTVNQVAETDAENSAILCEVGKSETIEILEDVVFVKDGQKMISNVIENAEYSKEVPAVLETKGLEQHDLNPADIKSLLYDNSYFETQPVVEKSETEFDLKNWYEKSKSPEQDLQTKEDSEMTVSETVANQDLEDKENVEIPIPETEKENIEITKSETAQNLNLETNLTEYDNFKPQKVEEELISETLKEPVNSLNVSQAEICDNENSNICIASTNKMELENPTSSEANQISKNNTNQESDSEESDSSASCSDSNSCSSDNESETDFETKSVNLNSHNQNNEEKSEREFDLKSWYEKSKSPDQNLQAKEDSEMTVSKTTANQDLSNKEHFEMPLNPVLETEKENADVPLQPVSETSPNSKQNSLNPERVTEELISETFKASENSLTVSQSEICGNENSNTNITIANKMELENPISLEVNQISNPKSQESDSEESDTSASCSVSNSSSSDNDSETDSESDLDNDDEKVNSNIDVSTHSKNKINTKSKQTDEKSPIRADSDAEDEMRPKRHQRIVLRIKKSFQPSPNNNDSREIYVSEKSIESHDEFDSHTESESEDDDVVSVNSKLSSKPKDSIDVQASESESDEGDFSEKEFKTVSNISKLSPKQVDSISGVADEKSMGSPKELGNQLEREPDVDVSKKDTEMSTSSFKLSPKKNNLIDESDFEKSHEPCAEVADQSESEYDTIPEKKSKLMTTPLEFISNQESLSLANSINLRDTRENVSKEDDVLERESVIISTALNLSPRQDEGNITREKEIVMKLGDQYSPKAVEPCNEPPIYNIENDSQNTIDEKKSEEAKIITETPRFTSDLEGSKDLEESAKPQTEFDDNSQNESTNGTEINKKQDDVQAEIFAKPASVESVHSENLSEDDTDDEQDLEPKTLNKKPILKETDDKIILSDSERSSDSEYVSDEDDIPKDSIPIVISDDESMDCSDPKEKYINQRSEDSLQSFKSDTEESLLNEDSKNSQDFINVHPNLSNSPKMTKQYANDKEMPATKNSPEVSNNEIQSGEECSSVINSPKENLPFHTENSKFSEEDQVSNISIESPKKVFLIDPVKVKETQNIDHEITRENCISENSSSSEDSVDEIDDISSTKEEKQTEELPQLSSEPLPDTEEQTIISSEKTLNNFECNKNKDISLESSEECNSSKDKAENIYSPKPESEKAVTPNSKNIPQEICENLEILADVIVNRITAEHANESKTIEAKIAPETTKVNELDIQDGKDSLTSDEYKQTEIISGAIVEKPNEDIEDFISNTDNRNIETTICSKEEPIADTITNDECISGTKETSIENLDLSLRNDNEPSETLTILSENPETIPDEVTEKLEGLDKIDSEENLDETYDQLENTTQESEIICKQITEESESIRTPEPIKENISETETKASEFQNSESLEEISVEKGTEFSETKTEVIREDSNNETSNVLEENGAETNEFSNTLEDTDIFKEVHQEYFGLSKDSDNETSNNLEENCAQTNEFPNTLEDTDIFKEVHQEYLGLGVDSNNKTSNVLEENCAETNELPNTFEDTDIFKELSVESLDEKESYNECITKVTKSPDIQEETTLEAIIKPPESLEEHTKSLEDPKKENTENDETIIDQTETADEPQEISPKVEIEKSEAENLEDPENETTDIVETTTNQTEIITERCELNSEIEHEKSNKLTEGETSPSLSKCEVVKPEGDNKTSECYEESSSNHTTPAKPEEALVENSNKLIETLEAISENIVDQLKSPTEDDNKDSESYEEESSSMQEFPVQLEAIVETPVGVVKGKMDTSEVNPKESDANQNSEDIVQEANSTVNDKNEDEESVPELQMEISQEINQIPESCTKESVSCQQNLPTEDEEPSQKPHADNLEPISQDSSKETALNKDNHTQEELSQDFLGFKNQSSFEDESEDFHGFEDLEEVTRIRQEIENLNDDSTANDGFLNYNILSRDLHKSSTTSLTGSTSSEINELEALEKELSQHQPELATEDDEEDKETEQGVQTATAKVVSTNDIEHIKQMLESDEEPQEQDENETNKDVRKPDECGEQSTTADESKDKSKYNLSSVNSIIPKLSDLCRAALNSSLNSNSNLAQHTTETSTILVERELSVEEALAEMYRQAGVLLSDPEDCDNDISPSGDEEAHDVLLINLQEILNSDNNDVYVLQCDMQENVLNVVQQSNEETGRGRQEPQNNNAIDDVNTNTERVNTVQFIGILDTQSAEPQIHIISSDSESEVILLSDDESDNGYRPFIARPERITIPFINDDVENDINNSDSLSDISTIHHEEIVPDNLNKFLQEEFYKYLHEKYVQRNISKYYHANRVLKKYRKRYIKSKRQ